jgi:hypothetical protein
LVSGSGIVLDGSSGVVTVTNSAPNIAQNVYRFLAVSGQPVLDPSGPTSTLNIITGSGISLISEPLSNTLTFNNTGVLSLSVDDGFTINSGTGAINLGIPQTLERNLIGDVHGSVFSDSSTLLVDGTNGKIVGDIQSSLAGIDTLEISNILYSPNLSNPNTSQLDIYSAGTILINSSEQMYLEITQAFAGDGASLSILAGAGSEETPIMNGNGGDVYIAAGHGPFGPAAVGGSVYLTGGNGVVKGGDIVLSGGDSDSDVIINNLKYPRIDGDPGQILSTDGSGVLTWINPPSGTGGGGGDFELNVASDDSTLRRINSGETLKFVGAGGISTSSDNEGQITITGPNLSSYALISSLGNIIFTGTTIDSSDSSGIVFTPAVIFNSDITVENELTVRNSATVSGTLTVNNLNVNGTITSQGSGTPEIFSDNEVLLTAGTRVEITGSPLKMASFTTGDRDLLTAINGDVIYNTTLNKFQGYANGTWVDFH